MDCLDLNKVTCRICSSGDESTDQLSNLFTKTLNETVVGATKLINDDVVLNMPLGDALVSFTCVELQRDHGLPETICRKCETQLIETLSFIHRTINTQKILNYYAARIYQITKVKIEEIDISEASSYVIEELNDEGEVIQDKCLNKLSVPLVQPNNRNEENNDCDEEDAVSFLKNIKRASVVYGPTAPFRPEAVRNSEREMDLEIVDNDDEIIDSDYEMMDDDGDFAILMDSIDAKGSAKDSAEDTAIEVLPASSKQKYMQAYHQFEKWRNEKKLKSISEKVLLAYFYELSKKSKPNSLWAYYSMLKTTIRVMNNIDTANFRKLLAFLKSKLSGYQPVQAKVFSEAEIQKFIVEASDTHWLDVKVVCIFAVCGGLRCRDLTKIKATDVTSHRNDSFVVRIPTFRNKAARSFTIGGGFYGIVQKYAALRVPNTEHSRFFVHFRNGKCSLQAIGVSKFSRMPRRIAAFLQLEDIERYMGHSFRKTSANMLANTSASMETINGNVSRSSLKFAEGNIENSLNSQKHTGDTIPSTIPSNGQVQNQFQDPLGYPLRLGEMTVIKFERVEVDG